MVRGGRPFVRVLLDTGCWAHLVGKRDEQGVASISDLHPTHSGLSGSESSKREVGNMEKLLLSPAEAAAHLSIGRSKVYELMRLGELRSVKIGASRRIPQAALADFIGALAQEPR
jgi:excisionase family DNA binding protein